MSERYNLTLFGDEGVGKSSLAIRFIQGNFSEMYDPTYKKSYRKQVVIDGGTCKLDILDTAGQEQFWGMHDHYIRISEGFLLVFALDECESLKSLLSYRERIRLAKESDEVPMVLVGNKCDLQQISPEIQELVNSFGIPFIETNTETGENVDQAFHAVVREIRKHTEKHKERSKKRRRCAII